MYKRNKVVALLLSISLLLYVFIPFPIAFAGSDYVTVNKTVNPDSIFVDEEAEVVLSVQGSPPVNVIVPNDVILIIDKSFSMNPAHEPNKGEDKIQNAKDAAKGFVDLMDMSKHRAGVVDFSSINAINSFDLTTDAASIKAHIDTIDANGGTATGDAIYKAMELLEAKRPEAQPVIVLLTDGSATLPKDGPVSAYDYAKQAAAEAKEQGIVFYTIALLNVDEDPDTSAPNLLLQEMATTAQHHHFVLGSIGLVEIYNRIVEEIGRASAYDVTLTDIVSPEFEIVPDSYIDNIPKPTVEGNKLTWNFQELKDEELTFTYRIRHKDGQQVGNLPVSSGSNINYLDYTDARVNQEIEAPSVTVKHYPPDIIDLSSDSSGVDGGDILTIYGEYFRPGLTVNFGDIEAVIDAFIGATEVRVVVPSGQQGDITITLTNDDGQFDTAAFNYFADPVINKIEPAAGLITGGTEVRIDGQYFMQDAQVKFGEQQAKSVIVSSDGTFITATTPEVPAPIVVDVHVINPDGTNIMAEKGFSYELPPGPEITLINPNEGEIGGGEIVFIDGTNFTADGTVYFGEKQGVNYYRVNNTRIRITSPVADVAGPVDVKVVNADGQFAVVRDGFLYTEPVLPPGPAPEITLITPNEGEMAGGETIVIEGSNFTSTGEVYFGDKKGTVYYCYNDSKIQVRNPAADVAGPVDVKVVNADEQFAVAQNGFLYTEASVPSGPEITLIDPNEGEIGGGEIVFIDGANFTTSGAVYFGEKQGVNYYRVNPTRIRITSPAVDKAGPVDVKVVDADGQSAVVQDGFLYKEPPGTAPEITLIDPNEGEIGGGEIVFIDG
ncbi:MAG: IPT/TIG domain-containing protein, partial [Firmicutes bacterium]|nr:IPT/TIG domain-containing protein [Bacillota bacterium]